MDLLSYKIFGKTLRSVDEVYLDLGCKWSIFGMFFFSFHSATDLLFGFHGSCRQFLTKFFWRDSCYFKLLGNEVGQVF